MAATVTERWSGDQSGLNPSGRSGRRVFDVSFSTASEASSRAARLATGIPEYRDAHPEDPFLWANAFSVTPRGPLIFEVAVDYISRVPPDKGTDPLDAPPILTWTQVVKEEPIDRTIDGKPIVNVNNEPFDPPLTESFADLALEIQRNLGTIEPTTYADYHNAVNSDNFLGFPAGTALMDQISATEATEADFIFWRVTAKVIFRIPDDGDYEKAWWRRVLNQGYMVREDNLIIRARDAEGNPTPSPVLLKADGTQEEDPANAVWLRFKTKKARNFAALGLLA